MDFHQGMTTSAQKLNRKAILEKYKDDVKKAYGGK
jgi:long-chain acyl-CoA synthetase